ncbi:MAG: hypothetical protein GY946_10530 [bacterium]|nr:hypothetical protein [bacterium]
MTAVSVLGATADSSSGAPSRSLNEGDGIPRDSGAGERTPVLLADNNEERLRRILKDLRASKEPQIKFADYDKWVETGSDVAVHWDKRVGEIDIYVKASDKAVISFEVMRGTESLYKDTISLQAQRMTKLGQFEAKGYGRSVFGLRLKGSPATTKFGIRAQIVDP